MTKILSILKSTGAIVLDSHVVLTSGNHSNGYINKDLMYIHTQKASMVGKLLAKHAHRLGIEVVAAPSLGGIVLSQWTAFHLSQLEKREILSVYTEKTPEKDQILTRGYDKVVAGKKVFVIEDLVTTGTSVKKVVEAVVKAGGKVELVGVMVDRSPEHEPVTEKMIGSPFFALGRLPIEVYPAQNCPMCKKNIPINTSVGHGKKFLAEQKNG